jgi:hypothetical protein
MGCCECGNEPSGSINKRNFMSSWGPVNFVARTVLNGVCLLVLLVLFVGWLVS